jgi:coenzyme F420-0:L-glutamate ligase / coenzyme F420-1:gamma-L-glutamate ligase
VLSARAVEGLPEISPGDDLAELIVSALRSQADSSPLTSGDVLAIAHKAVSKAEGRVRNLREVDPDERARELADRLGKDARHVQVILDESEQVLRAERGVLICVTRHGFVCANAGVDLSNVPGEDMVLLLPLDPDESARRIRRRIAELINTSPAVVITDSFGRAWRMGQSDVAIGCAGLVALDDWRGRTDTNGRELHATVIAVADELAAAADLARAKDLAQPAIVLRGAERHTTVQDGPGIGPVIRPETEDLFR